MRSVRCIHHSTNWWSSVPECCAPVLTPVHCAPVFQCTIPQTNGAMSQSVVHHSNSCQIAQLSKINAATLSQGKKTKISATSNLVMMQILWMLTMMMMITMMLITMKTITMMKITDAWDKVGPGGLAQRPNYALSTCSDDDDGGEDDDDDHHHQLGGLMGGSTAKLCYINLLPACFREDGNW